MARLLLEHHAGPKLSGARETALTKAIEYHNDNVIQLLLEHGVDVNGEPLVYAAGKGVGEIRSATSR